MEEADSKRSILVSRFVVLRALFITLASSEYRREEKKRRVRAIAIAIALAHAWSAECGGIGRWQRDDYFLFRVRIPLDVPATRLTDRKNYVMTLQNVYFFRNCMFVGCSFNSFEFLQHVGLLLLFSAALWSNGFGVLHFSFSSATLA